MMRNSTANGSTEAGITPLSRGELVPQAFRGVVASVFEHAANIRPDDERMLVTLVTRMPAMSARALLLPRLPCGLRAGATVNAAHGRIVFEGSEGGPIRVEDSPLYGGRIAAAAVPPGRPVVTALRRALGEHGAPSGLLGLVDSRASTLFSRHAARVLSGGDAFRRLSELVGLGPGLTPSGDDFIMGALAGEALLGAHDARIEPSAIEKRVAAGAVTTEVGATMVLLALGGRFPAYISLCAQELAAAEARSRTGVLRKGTAPADPGQTRMMVVRAVCKAVGYGATSGSDALVGLLWRLAASVGD